MTLVNDERAAHGVRTAGPAEASGLATALAAAFYDDPVFRFFSPDDGHRGAMLPGFFGVFVEAFMAHGETYADDAAAGAALWALPATDPIAADAGAVERLEAIAGVDAPRLFEIVETLEAHTPREAHYHLQFLGVRPERQGGGIGGALMAPMLARCDREGVAAYLEATSDRNRALYERHGFRCRGPIPVPGGPSLWQMWREPIGV